MTDASFNIDGHKVNINVIPHIKQKSRGKVIYDAIAFCPIKSCSKSANAGFAAYKKETAEGAKREVTLKVQEHYRKQHKN